MPEYSSKFSPRVKLFLSKLMAEENPIVAIFVRTGRILKPEDISQLEIIGAEMRTMAGNIITLSIPSRKLHVLAKKDFVKYIELTGPLHPE
jgi:hypothetical protein